MPSWLKSASFSALGKVYRFSYGTNLGKIPGSKAAFSLLMKHFWPGDHIREVQGSKMTVNPGALPERFSKTFRPFVFFGAWEQLTTRLFKKVVREGDIVADIGANMGYFTLLASRLAGEAGKVYAFEPEPVNHNILLKNIELNGYKNIIPLRKAVSDKNGKAGFFIHGTDSGRHVLQHYGDEVAEGELIEVESVSLDEFFSDKPLPSVIKMDIEGAELSALSGMTRIIESNEKLKIFTELYPSLIERAGHSLEGFSHKLMNDWHFSALAIDDYARNGQYVKIKDSAELEAFAARREVINLFLYKGDLPPDTVL